MREFHGFRERIRGLGNWERVCGGNEYFVAF